MSESEQRFERGAVITDVDHGRGILTAEMQGPITFQRPDPTEFVLLTARVGPGTTNVDPKLAHKFNVQAFKPAGTEYATERDLLDSGYVAVARLQPLRALLARAFAVLHEPDANPGDAAYKEALGKLLALDAALRDVSRETSEPG
jgi:hypothetical protein